MPSNAIYKGVIFDLFHTLTGLESEWSNLPPTCDVLGIDRRHWDEVLTQNSRWRLVGEVRDPYAVLCRLARIADPNISEQRVSEALRIRMQRFRDCFLRIPPANVTTLRRLKSAGYKLGLISNADAMEVASWNECALCGLFDVEIFSCDVGYAKPEPDIYRLCLERLALAPHECLFAGDGGSDELIGARPVGLSTVFVSGVIAELWPERIPARRLTADHHVVWMPEVLDLLGLDEVGGVADSGNF